MARSNGFLKPWRFLPLLIYAVGIVLPAFVAWQRPLLLPALGLTAYALLFWAGPFASAASLFWTDWTRGWRLVWIILIPVFAAPTFLPLVT